LEAKMKHSFNDDEIIALKNKWVEEGREHSSPSPLTKSFMEQTKNELTNLKITMAEFKKDLEFIKDSLVSNEEQHKEIIEKIDSFCEGLDKKYAPRILWTIAVWVGAIIGSTIILGILGLIAQAYLKFNT